MPKRCGTHAKRLVREGALLLDVRSAAEFADGHLDGAVNVPHVELSERESRWPREQRVVVYCGTGNRARIAAGALRAAGYDVYELGAMADWETDC